MTQQTLVFSDLDGCLLNKHDYSFDDARGVLSRLRRLKIPVILASSKTQSEMFRLAEEMQLADAPLICENGGAVFWSREQQAEGSLVLGVERAKILATLQALKSEYRFQSFADMGVDGVAEKTSLPADRAAAACDRTSTEPLLWLDQEERLADFGQALSRHGLTFTRGGRFWHVAGDTNKGLGMQAVLGRLATSTPVVSLAIGDSPIDQSMLDLADYPIGIPSPDGLVQVEVNAQNGLVADLPGAAGWAECVSRVLDQLGYE